MSVTIEITEYNPLWPQKFESEAAKIRANLKQENIEHKILHVGSTSIPGLVAKPRIDIILTVKELASFQKTSRILESIEYQAKGELNIPFRLFFSKSEGVGGVNLHLYEEDNPDIELNLQFQNYLRTHPEACKEYVALKKKLVQSSLSDPNSQGLNGYTLGKNTFIRNALIATGFDHPCIRFCSHYQEWETVSAFQHQYFPDHPPLSRESLQDGFCFVFYKGMEIVGYAHFKKTSPLQCICFEFQMITSYEDLTPHFLGLCKKWFAWEKIDLSLS